MINAINLPEALKNHYQVINIENSTLSQLNRINILIGPNNSGKSRFLRGLFSNDFTYQSRQFSFSDLYQIANSLLQEVRKEIGTNAIVNDISGSGITNVIETLVNFCTSLKSATLPKSFPLINGFHEYLKKLKEFHGESALVKPNVIASSVIITYFNTPLRKLGSDAEKNLLEITSGIENVEYTKIYVPMLRGLRPLQIKEGKSNGIFDNTVDNYKARTIRDYFSTNEDALREANIFTGQSMYEEACDLLLGSLEERNKIKEFEKFLSVSFFGGSPVSLTPNRKDDSLHLTIGTEDRPIYHLGDGIQNLIVLLYPIFFNSGKTLLCFIEEPELSLHPGMQRLFIDTVMKPEFASIQFFFTTHSNHFLDMVLDHSQISLYNFKRDDSKMQPEYHITNSNNSDIALLDCLGIRNSSVFISNCTIWVEGITDRFYLNKFMEVYQQNLLKEKYEIDRLKEDLHYSFIEYGGANIVHYSFDDEANWEKIKATSISTKIMLVIDEDGTTGNQQSKKYQRIEELRAILKDQLIVLPCREIENTLSKRVLQAVINEREKRSDLDFSKIRESKLLTEYLGKYIQNNIPDLSKEYSAKSGTIADKVSFCKLALNHIQTIDDLTPAGLEVTEKIYTFIKKNN